MRRAIRFAVLSLLLLAMQQQGYVHPIAHFAGHEEPSQETVVSAPHADEPCGLCTLLAGGSLAVVAGVLPHPADVPDAGIVFHTYRSRAADVPAWFESRAPPVLL